MTKKKENHAWLTDKKMIFGILIALVVLYGFYTFISGSQPPKAPPVVHLPSDQPPKALPVVHLRSDQPPKAPPVVHLRSGPSAPSEQEHIGREHPHEDKPLFKGEYTLSSGEKVYFGMLLLTDELKRYVNNNYIDPTYFFARKLQNDKIGMEGSTDNSGIFGALAGMEVQHAKYFVWASKNPIINTNNYRSILNFVSFNSLETSIDEYYESIEDKLMIMVSGDAVGDEYSYWNRGIHKTITSIQNGGYNRLSLPFHAFTAKVCRSFGKKYLLINPIESMAKILKKSQVQYENSFDKKSVPYPVGKEDYSFKITLSSLLKYYNVHV